MRRSNAAGAAGSPITTRMRAARIRSTSCATYAADGGTPGRSSMVAAIVRRKRRAKYGHVSCAVTTRTPANGSSARSHRARPASRRVRKRARFASKTALLAGASAVRASPMRAVMGRAASGSSQ